MEYDIFVQSKVLVEKKTTLSSVTEICVRSVFIFAEDPR